MNDENLVPQASRSPSEAREMGRKGGIASGASRRARKDMAALARMVLEQPAGGKTRDVVRRLMPNAAEGDLTLGAATVVAQVDQALKGSTKAFEALARVSGAGSQGPQDAEERPFCADYALLLADPYMRYHRAVCAGLGGDYFATGGRASAKSSWAALEIVGGMMRDPRASALVMMRVGKDMRSSVATKIGWAIDLLGVADQWQMTKSPLEWVRVSTGQKIMFKGGDDTAKSKGFEPPLKTYFKFVWFEEFDQFDGMADLRTVLQSVTRGAPDGAPFFRFYTCNPPRTRAHWANVELAAREAEGGNVLRTTCLDVPPEWVTEQQRQDMARLKELDPEAYRHEYLGEPVGYGAAVFPRAEVREVSMEELDGFEYLRYGVDWGFAADPWVWVEVAYDKRTRTLYVLRELSGRGLTNRETAAMVAEAMEDTPYAPVECDSAEPKSVQEWRDLGIKARKAPKQGFHSVRDSVKWLQNRCAIVIDPSCRLAAAEFPAYEYERRGDEVTGNLPDRDNHAIDAVRYACASLIDDRTNI